MQILPDIYLVGSGDSGIGLSHPNDCNVYLIDGGDGLYMIDSGVNIEPERIIENIESHGFCLSSIKQIILTHGHADHAGGAYFFREKTGACITALGIEAEAISKGDEVSIGLDIARRAGYYPPDYKMTPCPIDRCLSDEDEIEIGKYRLKVIWTPGHSKGSMCLYGIIGGSCVLFSGDEISFNGLISLQNIPGVDIHDYSRGVKRLSGLGIDALLPGHLLFTVTRGQRHIDMAVDAFSRLGIPKSVI